MGSKLSLGGSIEKTQNLTRVLSSGELLEIKVVGPLNFNELEDPDLENQKQFTAINIKNAMIRCMEEQPHLFTPQYSENEDIIGCFSIHPETGKPFFIRI